MSHDHDPAFLDVEDDEQRQKRIGTILTRLNTTSPHDRRSSTIPNPFLDIGPERSPGSVEPPTELLTRVQAFLPTIAAANEALARRDPADIDIENIAGSEERYVEISWTPPPSLTNCLQNLGLGVFEARPRPEPGSRSSHSSEAESASDGTSSESESDAEVSISSSNEDEDSDSSFDDDHDDSDGASRSGSSVDVKPVSSRHIKPLPRRSLSQRPKLEV